MFSAIFCKVPKNKSKNEIFFFEKKKLITMFFSECIIIITISSFSNTEKIYSTNFKLIKLILNLILFMRIKYLKITIALFIDAILKSNCIPPINEIFL